MMWLGSDRKQHTTHRPMRHTKPARQSFLSLFIETARETVSDFVCGGLPFLGACAGVLSVILVPLWLVARSAGVL